MKLRITFWRLLANWFPVTVILLLVNMFTIKIPVVHNIILASLGIILLIFPIYPLNLEMKYTEKQCRIFIRVIAVLEIILSFSIRSPF